MKVITNAVKKEHELSKVKKVHHWYGSREERYTEHSTVDTFEYEVTDLSEELQKVVDAVYRTAAGYKDTITELDNSMYTAFRNIF